MESKSVFSEMWDSYKRVILHSIVTSFGLDLIIRDQNGGNVDTIHNVRADGQYKNADNAAAYANRGDYDSTAYHNNEWYNMTIHQAREIGDFFDDAYVPGNTIYYGKASALRTTNLDTSLGTQRKANLDHTISANEIHNDRGRVLAGLDGVELANSESNLNFTNESLNKRMRDTSKAEYIEKHPEMPEDEKSRILEKDAEARKSIDKRINDTYYTSDKFLIDAGKAAAKLGVSMGIRQALGFVFIEVYVACEKELKALPAGVNFGDCLQAIKVGIQNGFETSKSKYKEILSQFGEGFVAGALASLGTTLINIFVTTDKNMVRYIRQISVIVIQTGNILLINPNDLRLGDQLKAATVSVATGASVLAGTFVGNQIEKTPLGADEHVGRIVCNFCSALVSGMLSCTLLIMVDRSGFINKLVAKMNQFVSEDYTIQETAEAFKKLAAKIASYDISEFIADVDKFDSLAMQITSAGDEELNSILRETYDAFDIPIPWDGDFDSFMENKTNKIVFD